MDSMVGYKNDTYLYFGWAAAKLDDVLNWIPARLSAWLMIVSAFFLGLDLSLIHISTVFIGNSQTRVINGRLVTPRGYIHQ